METLTGQLLIAGPSLWDPNFRRTVLLVGHHDEEGAVGVILNRASETTVAEAVPPLGPLVPADDPVYLGGPVQPDAAVVIADFVDPAMADFLAFDSIGFLPSETEPGIEDAVRRARVFAGYAGWGPGQLEAELEEDVLGRRTGASERRVLGGSVPAVGGRAEAEGVVVRPSAAHADRPDAELTVGTRGAIASRPLTARGGSMASETFTFYIQPWYRKSPYFEATKRAGCKSWGLYNHMLLPTLYDDPVTEYRALLNDVTMWDVSVERCVEITGPDAFELTNLITCRDLTTCDVWQCKYVLLTAADGGIVNDPVLLRLGENHFWLALADSDALLYVAGVAAGRGMDVTIREADVAPMQIQGPRSKDVIGACSATPSATSATTGARRPRSTGSRWSCRGPDGPARSATRSTCATRRAATTCGRRCGRPASRSASGRSRRRRLGGSRRASSTTAATCASRTRRST